MTTKSTSGLSPKKIESIFKKHDDDFLKWEDVPAERRRHTRPDIHVFLMLDEKFPPEIADERNFDIIAWSEHDEFGFDIDIEGKNTLTEVDLRDMIRAGLRLDNGGFRMFA